MVIEHVDVGYRSANGSKILVADICASLMPASLVALVGRNGTGKSTLLRTLAGFLPPLAGTISMGQGMGQGIGQGIVFTTSKKVQPHTLAKLVSVVLTNRPALSNLRVEEVVALGRSPYTNFWGTLTSADQNIVSEAMRLVGICNLKNRQMQALSDGEQQKVFLAKALAQQTPVILLDEPTAFLDYQSKKEVMHLLRQLAHNEGKSILLSTHDIPQAIAVADNIWYIEEGRLFTNAKEKVNSLI